MEDEKRNVNALHTLRIDNEKRDKQGEDIDRGKREMIIHERNKKQINFMW